MMRANRSPAAAPRCPAETDAHRYPMSRLECSDEITTGCVPPQPVCGNGVIELGEACDDGPDNSIFCCYRCRVPFCGDSIVQCGEACDDGNLTDDDGCSNLCIPAPAADAPAPDAG